MNPFSKIKVLAFDIFGTVVDWHASIVTEVEKLALNIDANQFALDWRSGYRPAMDQVLSGHQPWTSIDDIHRLILDELLVKYQISSLTEAQKTDLNLVWHRLNPWPDTVAALNQLKQEYIICTLSNGNIRLLVDLAKHVKLPWDTIFSAENFKAYKPAPQTYLGVAELLNVSASEVMMVATHQDDLAAARSCGLRTAYIERPFEYGAAELKDSSPCIANDLHATDLFNLLDLLKQKR